MLSPCHAIYFEGLLPLTSLPPSLPPVCGYSVSFLSLKSQASNTGTPDILTSVLERTGLSGRRKGFSMRLCLSQRGRALLKQRLGYSRHHGILARWHEKRHNLYTNKFGAKLIYPKKCVNYDKILFLTKLRKRPKRPKKCNKRPKSKIKLQNVPTNAT